MAVLDFSPDRQSAINRLIVVVGAVGFFTLAYLLYRGFTAQDVYIVLLQDYSARMQAYVNGEGSAVPYPPASYLTAYAWLVVAGTVVIGILLTSVAFVVGYKWYSESVERASAIERLKQNVRLLDNNARILYAEDSPEDIELMRELVFSPLNLTVETVDNGAAAVEKLREQRYDLVILDMRLPLVSGVEVFRQLRAGEKTLEQKTPVIVTTGYTGGKEVESLYEVGAPTFFKKPIDYTELRSFIQRLCYA